MYVGVAVSVSEVPLRLPIPQLRCHLASAPVRTGPPVGLVRPHLAVLRYRDQSSDVRTVRAGGGLGSRRISGSGSGAGVQVRL